MLVARAFEKGVRVLALTDHDTLEGLDEAREAAQALGMQLVNGVELSCTWGGATIHVLGYGFDQLAPPLVAAIAQLHDGRWLRSEEISRKLSLNGMPGALEGARAIQQEWIHHAGYVGISALESTTASLCWIGGIKLARTVKHRASPATPRGTSRHRRPQS